MDALGSLIDAYLDARLDHDPVQATLVGDHRADGELPDPTERAVDIHRRRLLGLRRRLESLDLGGGDGAQRIDARLLRRCIDTDLLRLDGLRLWERDPSTALTHLGAAFLALMVRQSRPVAERAAAALDRLERVPGYLEDVRATIPAAADIHVEAAELIATSLRPFLADAVGRWIVTHRPELAERTAAAARRVEEAIATTLSWVRALPRLGTAACGEDVFEALLRTGHLMDTSAAAIRARGEELIAHTTEALQRIAARRDPNLDWRQQIAQLKRDHPPPEGVLDAYREGMRWARDLVVRDGLVPPPPEPAPLEVEPTPAPWRPTIPYAAYLEPAALGGDRTGRFWVTPVDDGLPAEVVTERLEGHCRAAIRVVAVHEGEPGHHLQLAWATCHPSRLRRIADAPMFVEGWAFYCEELFAELGHYDDATRLYQLKEQLWRAVRVILDVDLHCAGRPVEDAVRELVETAGLEPSNARAEVRRYCSTPTYQLSYAIGKEEFLALRARLRHLDARTFHQRVLELGNLPLPLAAAALEGR